jgi:hypothetical protein
MLNLSKRNCLYFCFKETPDKEILDCLENFILDYNLDIYLHKFGQEPKIKQGYNKNILLFYAKSKDEMHDLKKIHDQLVDKEPGRVLLCAKDFDCSDCKPDFNAEKFINFSDMSTAKGELKSFFERTLARGKEFSKEGIQKEVQRVDRDKKTEKDEGEGHNIKGQSKIPTEA